MNDSVPGVGQVARQVEPLGDGHGLSRPHAQNFRCLLEHFDSIHGRGLRATLLGLLHILYCDCSRLPHQVQKDVGHLLIEQTASVLLCYKAG
jgi:hypothetical protein